MQLSQAGLHANYTKHVELAGTTTMFNNSSDSSGKHKNVVRNFASTPFNPHKQFSLYPWHRQGIPTSSVTHVTTARIHMHIVSKLDGICLTYRVLKHLAWGPAHSVHHPSAPYTTVFEPKFTTQRVCSNTKHKTDSSQAPRYFTRRHIHINR
jgi:hypothetical protein